LKLENAQLRPSGQGGVKKLIRTLAARWDEDRSAVWVCRADGQPRRFAATEVLAGQHEVFAVETCTGADNIWVLTGPAGGSAITRRHRYTVSGKYEGFRAVI